MFTVLWLSVYTVGLPVQILTISSDYFDSQNLFIAFKIYTISSYTRIIVAVVWVSVIKKKDIFGDNRKCFRSGQ
jgi:hypothetical protein